MARIQKTRKELLELLNTKAVYSAASGKPVTFVDEITFAERANPSGIYSDLRRLLDNTAGAEEDLKAMFAVDQEGTPQDFSELLSRLGDPFLHPDAVYRNAQAVLADRADVTITPSEEGEEEEVSVTVYNNEGCDVYAGIAMKTEDIAPDEVFTELIQRCGASIRDSMIEYMATVYPAEGEEGEDHLVELLYRISGGDAWFRACSLGIKEAETDMDELFPQLLQDVIPRIDWERILDSAPLPAPPTIGSGRSGKVLRPTRRR